MYTWFRCKLCHYEGEGEVEELCPNCKAPNFEFKEPFCPVCGRKAMFPWWHLIQAHGWMLREKVYCRGYNLLTIKYASPPQ